MSLCVLGGADDDDGKSVSHSSSSSSSQDAAFNKTSRSLQELQQKELGVKPEFRSELHCTADSRPPHLCVCVCGEGGCSETRAVTKRGFPCSS